MFLRNALSLASILLLLTITGHGQLNAWKFKFPMIIKNKDGKSRTNYVYKLTLNTKSLVGTGNLDVSGKDLRFATDCEGKNLLNYWIEKDFNTPSTVVWIYLSKLDSAENKVIYLFGKNPAATPASNFNSTFVSQLIVDANNFQFQTIRDSVWKYNYIEIKQGVTSQFNATSANGTPSRLVLDASMIVISGTLSANGAGFAGLLASNGQGPGAGLSAPLSGNAGGGGGNAGNGGRSSYSGAISNSGPGGTAYGTASDFNYFIGSSGGSSGLLNTGKAGGNGAGAFVLIAEDIKVTGKITANGSNGMIGLGGCSGGGAGGSIILNARDITINGELSVRGGNGGTPLLPGFPGGGAGGGYIKLLYGNTLNNSALISVDGGNAGTNNCCTAAENGQKGIIYEENIAALKASISNYSPLPISCDQSLPVCQNSQIEILAPKNFGQYDYYVNDKLVYTGNSGYTTTANHGDKFVVGMYTGTGCFVLSDTLEIKTKALSEIILNTGSTKNICDNETFTLTATTNSPGDFQWAKEGTEIADATTNTYTVSTPGNYTVSFINADHCKSTSNPIKVIVNENPAISAISGTFTICEGDSFQAVAGATLPGTFQWFCNETPVTSGPEIFAKKAGKYYCQITTEQSCKGNTDILEILLNTSPNPVIDTSLGGGTLCGPNAILNVSVPPDYLSYGWTRNGTPLNTYGNEIVIDSEGTYSVAVMDQFGCRGSSSAVEIKKMGSYPSVSGLENTICSNDSILIGNPQSIPFRTRWKLNGMEMPFTSSVIFAKDSGTYIYTISNGGYCQLSYTTIVHHKAAPSGLLNTTKDTTFCEGSEYQLSITTSTTGISWYNNATQVGANVDKINPYNSGSYYAVLTADGCTFTTQKVKVNVLPIPATPSFTVRYDSLISYYPGGNQWLLNGQVIPGATGRIYHIKENGDYSLINTNDAGCQSDTSTVLAFRSTGVSETTNVGLEVNLFPNPFQHSFNIRTEGEFSWSVSDATGRLILSGTNTDIALIDMNQLQTGAYYVMISGNKGQVTKQLIKL